LTGVALPETEIDGKNVWDLISGKPGASNANSYYAFSTGNNFESILSSDGKWKLHLPHNYRTLIDPGNDGAAGKYEAANIELSLYDMENDPYESNNIVEKYPEITKKLVALADFHREKFYSD
jgi:hypothetical protein